jgi:oligoendopeptidase F
VCEDKTYILKVKEFLGSGSSVSPEDLFKNLGIDVNSAEFWELGLKEFEDNLDLAERLAKELGMD